MFEPCRGSEWRKWDLHVHSPFTKVNDNYSIEPSDELTSDNEIERKWEKFFKILKEKETAVVGITDYFSIENYKTACYMKDRFKVNNICLLPNIEFRIAQKNKDSEFIQIHVIFSNRDDIVCKLDNFLTRLPLISTDDYNLTNKYCTNDDLCQVTYKKALINEKILQEKLKNDFIPIDDFIIVGVARGYGSIRPGREDDGRGGEYAKEVDKLCQVFFGNSDDVDFYLNKTRERYKNAIPKAVVHCCDAHKYNDLGNKFTWIKADPTFEGLKQIIYEPELRVRIQKEDPSESETFAKINSLGMNFPQDLRIKDESGESTDFCLNGTYTINFSNNLTCIIGGRGSGKSTLAHVIYNSWINNDSKKLSTINSPLVNLEMHPSPLKKVAEVTICNVPSQTEFFFQNEIEHAAKNIDSMSTLISNRLEKLSSLDGGEILGNLRENWTNSSVLVKDLINAYDQISSITATIQKAQDNINTLKRQTEIIKSDEYKQFQTRIEELTVKIAEFNSYKTDYEKVDKQIDLLITSVTRLNWTEDQGKLILENFLQNLQISKGKLQETFNKVKSDYDIKDFPTQLINVQQDLINYLNSRGISPENVHELTQANTKIKELEEQIRLAKLEKSPFDELYLKKEQTIEAYKHAYEVFKERFCTVSLLFQQKLAGLSISEKVISFDLLFDYARLKSEIVEFFKTSLEEDAILRSDAIERLLFENVSIEFFIQNKLNIRQHLAQSSKTGKHRQIIEELINDDEFLEKLHLQILKHYFNIDNINVQTKLGGKILKNTSFGERCGIVISIILVAGTNPIIIDQPEDHLDGKFISDVLVPLIRHQKYNRQIILITRDANIVIGGDAELINILEPTDNRTEITPSTLENLECREKYIWILDGGIDAFSRREQKYDIQLLLAQKEITT